jgi:LysR family transcriptional regulator, glycine cleavage system transcriptional activator
MRTLSRLKAIHAFETVARHASYVAAAKELNVTPAAVGQQIRALESWLGIPLFRRLDSGTSRLVLTEEARAAAEDFREGFDRLDAGLRRLRARRSRAVINVTASQAFVAKWLLPRLDRFTTTHPDCDVRLDVTDRLVDIAHGDADIALRCGLGNWPGVVSTQLMREEVFPVASPTLIGARGRSVRRPQDFAKHTLIHDATVPNDRAFPGWRAWLKWAEVSHRDIDGGLRINASAAVIQAAINGQGIALARAVLVKDDLAAKRLVRLCPKLRWPIPWAYFIVHREGALERPQTLAFFDWLIAMAEYDR